MPRLLRLEDQALLLCTHQDLTKDHIQALHSLDLMAFDWDQVLQTALNNHIAPLVYSNLEKAGVELPPDVALGFKKDYIDNLLRKKEARTLLSQALIRISDWQIEYQIPLRLMLVKGAALNALIYAKPWYTRSADIDLLFDLPASSLPEDARHQLVARLNGLNRSSNPFRTHLEFDFYIHHDININGLLPMNTERIWRDAKPILLDGHSLMVMSPEDILIAAAVSCCRRRYFYLKPLLDLSECTRRLDNLNWEKVIEIAQSDQVSGILYAGLWLATECLDAQTPAWVFTELKISSLQKVMLQRLASFILAHFSFAHLTKVWDENNHPLTAALAFTYFAYQPAQSVRQISRSLESVLHG